MRQAKRGGWCRGKRREIAFGAACKSISQTLDCPLRNAGGDKDVGAGSSVDFQAAGRWVPVVPSAPGSLVINSQLKLLRNETSVFLIDGE